VVGGPFLPLAIIFYWFSNNIWTFGQQHYVFGMIEKEEEEKKREALERRSANAPAPGAKPKRSARNAAAATGSADGETPATESSEADTGNTDETPRNGNPGNRAPRPGAKPRKRKR
jgi:YidC/Oxa1 family membrane protein insertase